MIKHVRLNHGLNYFYRIHTGRLDGLMYSGLLSLKQYLADVSISCHEDIFKTGPRSSSLKFDLDIPLTKIKGHKLSKLAKLALSNYNGTPHDKVQACALDNDPNSLCVELPIWLKLADVIGMPINKNIIDKVFTDGELLTGHVDLVTVEDGLIWIWDFKPNAHKERYAATQVFFYALMLARRTKLSLDKFRCGYFDENVAYLFKPELGFLE